MNALNLRDQTILEGLVQNCQSINDRLSRFSIDKEIFKTDSAMREMILFPLLQIGELSNHLSEEFILSDKGLDSNLDDAADWFK